MPHVSGRGFRRPISPRALADAPVILLQTLDTAVGIFGGGGGGGGGGREELAAQAAVDFTYVTRV